MLILPIQLSTPQSTPQRPLPKWCTVASEKKQQVLEQSDDLYEGQQRFIKQHRVGDEMTFDIPQSIQHVQILHGRLLRVDTVYVIKSKTNAPVGTISAYGLNEERILASM